MPIPFPGLPAPQTYMGLPVYITGDMPKMQLSRSVCEVLKPDFVREMNTWLLEFFGTANLLKDGEIIFNDGAAFRTGGSLHMNARTFEQLRLYTSEAVLPNDVSERRATR